MQKPSLFFVIVSALFLSCCTPKQKAPDTDSSTASSVKYAKGFDIRKFNEYTQLTVYNPWVPDAVQQRIYLVNDPAIKTPADGRRIKIPVHSVAISSSTHTEPLQLIGEIESVSAACTPELIYNKHLSERFSEGKLISLGDAFNVNLEQLLIAHPDIYMVASYNRQDDNTNRLLQAGIPVVYNNEWTETSLLARAEWIKYVAVFFGKEAVADSLFRIIEHDYIEAKQLSANLTHKPTVMAGSNFKGTWYMPGGKSYMGQLFADAGADYFYADDTTTASLPLNFETVLHNFSNADVWLNAPTATIDELMLMDERHNLFDAAKNSNVYSFNARTTQSGANDFWESAVTRPDLILKDVIWALHPDIMSDYSPFYIMKLQ